VRSPIGIIQRTGWTRLPLSKSSVRPGGQQAYKPIGSSLSSSEKRLSDLIQEAYNSIPTAVYSADLTESAIAAQNKLALSTLTSYSERFQEVLQAQYEASAELGVKELRAILSRSWAKLSKASDALPSKAIQSWGFNGKGVAAADWAKTEAGKLITNMTVTQQETFRQVINTSQTLGRTPATSARVLVETLNSVAPSTPTAISLSTLLGVNANGLTVRYEQAVVNRATSVAQSLADKGITGQKAVDKVRADTQKYADQLRRSRSVTIARTETMMANNEGRLATFQQAVNDGMLSKEHSRKIWSTSPMDVCPICVPLNGQMVKIDEEFSNGRLTPPAHPRCRCSFDIEPNVKLYEPPTAVGSGTPSDPYRFQQADNLFTPQGSALSQQGFGADMSAPTAPPVLPEALTANPRTGTFDKPIDFSRETAQTSNGRLRMKEAFEEFKPTETHTRVIQDLDSPAGRDIPTLISRTQLDEVAEDKARKILEEVDDLIANSESVIPDQGFQAVIRGAFDITDEAARDLITSDGGDIFYNPQHLRVNTYGLERKGIGWRVEASFVEGTRFVPINTTSGEILMPRGMSYVVTSVDEATRIITVSYNTPPPFVSPTPLPTNTMVHRLRDGLKANGYAAWQDPIIQTLREGEVIVYEGIIPGFGSLNTIQGSIITRQQGVIIIEEVFEQSRLSEVVRQGKLLSQNKVIDFNADWAQQGNIGQTIRQTVETLKQVASVIPESSPTFTRQIVLSLKANPQDANWAKKYNMPGFTSGATGGRYAIFSYGGRPVGVGTFGHEFGHGLDHSTIFGSFRVSESPAWTEAAKSDSRTTFKMVPPWEYATGNKRAIFGSRFISKYAFSSHSDIEDFAESVALYLQDRNSGYLVSHPDTGVVKTFADLFPERAKILRGIFGV